MNETRRVVGLDGLHRCIMCALQFWSRVHYTHTHTQCIIIGKRARFPFPERSEANIIDFNFTRNGLCLTHAGPTN